MFRWTFASAVLALLALAAPAARATDASCAEECLEARRVCHRAAHAAHTACQDRCAEAVQNAVERAREACRRESLGPAECAALVQQASYAAGISCRTDCLRVRARALILCGSEIAQCSRACQDVDPACAAECRGAAAECRGELGECGRGCLSSMLEQVAECRAQAQETCTLEGLGACVLEARRAGARCSDECHATYECGGELRECLGSCID
jgi:hypothetical protein